MTGRGKDGGKEVVDPEIRRHVSSNPQYDGCKPNTFFPNRLFALRFQYAAQQFDALRSLSSVALIRKALHELPEGLDETYDRLLLSIDPKFQTQVANSLIWLAFSFEPLKLEALAEIFILRPDEEVVLDETERLFRPQEILKYFSSLVITYDRVDLWPNFSTYVRLAHFSIKEYLTSDRIARGRARHFAISEVDAHLYIANSCIAYHLHHSSSYEAAIRDYQVDPLSWYARHYWYVLPSPRLLRRLLVQLSVKRILQIRDDPPSMIRHPIGGDRVPKGESM